MIPLGSLARGVAICALLLLLLSCAPTTAQNKFTEDVRLSSGEVLVVERTHHYSITKPLGSAASYLLDSATVRLRGQQEGQWLTGTWSEPLKVLLIDRDVRTNEYVIVATYETCAAYQEFGQPHPRYLEYRSRGDTWRRVSLSDLTLGRHSNALVSVEPVGEVGHVTLEAKKFRDLSPAIYRPFKKIDPKAGSSPCESRRRETNGSTPEQGKL